MNTRKTIAAAAAFTYIDFLFKYVASFLYFWDNIDRFCVFESSSDKTVPLCKTSSMFWTWKTNELIYWIHIKSITIIFTYHNSLHIL